MVLVIESIVACILFTALMLPSVYKNPNNHIMSYPKVIRERVESLPQYTPSWPCHILDDNDPLK